MNAPALRALVDLIVEEVGLDRNCKDEPDFEAVGWSGDGKPLPMTFGHVRRARQELEMLEEL